MNGDIPWTAYALRSAWMRACRKAGIRDVTFSDLRGTFVTRAAVAGSTEAQIAGVTGYSIRDVKSILDKHYLGHDKALGEAAIHKLEARTNLQSGLQSGSLIVAVE